MVTGYSRNGFAYKAIECFRDMRREGNQPNQFTFPSVLTACAAVVHCLIVKTGYGTYKLVNNALVDMYAKRGIMDSAVKVFERMIERDVISWTALVTGNTHNGSYEEALKLFCNMRAEGGISPDQFITASVLSASAELTLLESGQQMQLVWKAILAASRKHGNIENGERAAKTLMELEPNNAVPYVLLSNMYSAAERQEEAANIRRLMKSRNRSKEPPCLWGLPQCNEVHI
ncbi:hypothetical protein N665_0415s0037 [Sinapis alba]|nr:hypothetical protein N665_0415s0037 [Sinapis alba]